MKLLNQITISWMAGIIFIALIAVVGLNIINSAMKVPKYNQNIITQTSNN